MQYGMCRDHLGLFEEAGYGAIDGGDEQGGQRARALEEQSDARDPRV
jgi:hypothetical protein